MGETVCVDAVLTFALQQYTASCPLDPGLTLFVSQSKQLDEAVAFGYICVFADEALLVQQVNAPLCG